MAKLFTLGPVEMYPSTKAVYQKDIIHFRTKEYSEIVNSTFAKLNNLLGNSNHKNLIYLSASGTGAMEGVVENCVTPKSKALVINGGAFGHRFCELLAKHNIPFDSINLEWNETLTREHFTPYENKGYTDLFVNLHETSTGQLYDIKILNEFCKRNHTFLIVDAISTFLADEYNMEENGIDVTIISSQKGLCLSPGMSIIAFSERMVERIHDNPISTSSYFDFKDYLINIKRGQTPYTPPVHIMYELQDMLNLIENEGGKEARLKSVEKRCLYFRNLAKEAGLSIPDYPHSNMLTPIEFKDIDAYQLIEILKNKYEIYTNPCGGELAHTLLRISHIGNTILEDFDDLINKIKVSIEELKKDKINA